MIVFIHRASFSVYTVYKAHNAHVCQAHRSRNLKLQKNLLDLLSLLLYAESMIKDGQSISYRSWMADDSLRQALAAPGVMPKYFKALQEGIEEPEEGTSVMGYRLVQRLPDGTLIQPFIARLGSPEYAIKMVDISKGETSLFTDISKIYTTQLGQVNADPTGQGYYYFPERDIAEDYMRAFVYKSAEKFRFNKTDFGNYELYRVRGIAKPNTRGDEGFLMDEMTYDPEPLISIPVADPYRETHK